MEELTFRREAHGSVGNATGKVAPLGRLLLAHPRVLRGKGGGGERTATIGAVSGPAVARMAARVEAGDGLLEGRRQKCRP